MTKLFEIKKFINNKFSLNKGFAKYYNLGVDSFSKQDYVKAIEFFKIALDQPNFMIQAYYNLALSYQKAGDYDRAIVNYAKFLEHNPQDFDGLYNLGLVYYVKENYHKAIEFFEKSNLIKEDEDGVKSLVSAYLADNQIDNALNFSEKILNEYKNNESMYFAAAKIFENKKSFSKDFSLLDKAIRMYLDLAEKNPSNFQAFLAASICHAKKGEWDYSVDYCKKALEANPQSYEANNQMGLVYYCCDNIEKAVEFYETALKINPKTDFKIYSNLGYAYEKLGDFNKAIKIFSQLINKFPNFPAKDEIKNHLRILKSL